MDEHGLRARRAIDAALAGSSFPSGDFGEWDAVLTGLRKAHQRADGDAVAFGQSVEALRIKVPAFRALMAMELPDTGERASLADIGERIGATTWLWPDWLPYGYLTCLAAPSKGIKSAFALNLSGAAIGGGFWPDMTAAPDEQGYVIWCESEGRMGVNLERARDFEVPLDRIILPLPKPDELKPFRLDDPEHMAHLRAAAERYKPRMIVLDSLGASHAAKEADPLIGRLLADLQTVMQDFGAAGLVLHHLRKPPRGDRIEPSMDELRGSSAIPAACVSILMIDHPDQTLPTRRAQVVENNLTRQRPSLGVGWAERDGKGVLAFGDAPSAPFRETAYRKANDAVCDALADGEPQLRKEVIKQLTADGHASRNIDQAAAELEANGRLERERAKVKGGPATWRLITGQ